MLIPTLPEKQHFIVERPDKLRGLKCSENNLISWNPNDAKYGWCEACKLFVKVLPDIVKLEGKKKKQPGTLNDLQG